MKLNSSNFNLLDCPRSLGISEEGVTTVFISFLGKGIIDMLSRFIEGLAIVSSALISLFRICSLRLENQCMKRISEEYYDNYYKWLIWAYEQRYGKGS